MVNISLIFHPKQLSLRLGILRRNLASASRSTKDRGWGTFLWFFYVFLSYFVMPLRASVYLCLVVTCWERAEVLALVCGV